MIYKGKEIATFSDWELEQCIYEFTQAEVKREEASKHPKFNKSNNEKAMEFPPINPQYLILKQEITKELEKRKSHA